MNDKGGRTKKEIDKATTESIISLFRSGYGIQKIADMYGVTYYYVKRCLSDNGEDTRNKLNRNKRDIRKLTKGTPIDCDHEGGKCKYRTAREDVHKCDYLCKVGHSRGCDPTECTVWEVGKRRRNGKEVIIDGER